MSKENRLLPLEQINNLPKGKEVAKVLQQQILEGELNPLEVSIFLKKVAKIEKELTEGENGKKVKEAIVDEILKYQVKSTSKAYGAEIREQNRSFYDFSVCNDELWNDLTEIEKKVAALKKEREEELKALHPDNQKTKGFGIQKTSLNTEYTVDLIIEKIPVEVYDVEPPLKGVKTIHAYYV